jgi:hypothetical protein
MLCNALFQWDVCFSFSDMFDSRLRRYAVLAALVKHEFIFLMSWAVLVWDVLLRNIEWSQNMYTGRSRAVPRQLV